MQKRHTDIEYTAGQDTERRLIKFLRDEFFPNLVPADEADNFYRDIDAVDGNISYSIKTQHTCLRTGNLAFEISVNTANGATHPGWYIFGEAHYYLLVVGNNLYQCDRNDLKRFIDIAGFDRRTHLTASTIASQKKIGHAHVNADIGLVKLNNLLESGVLRWVCELPNEVTYHEGHRVPF